MAIYRILQNSPLGPEEIARLSTAYEQALRTIGVKDRNDPLTELIAKKIIEIRPASKTPPKFAVGPSKRWSCRKSDGLIACGEP